MDDMGLGQKKELKPCLFQIWYSVEVREVKEETRIDIELIKFCGLYQNITRGVCNNIFTGKPIGGALTTSDESDEVGYFTLEEAQQMITWGNFYDRIQNALDEKSHPFLIEFSE